MYSAGINAEYMGAGASTFDADALALKDVDDELGRKKFLYGCAGMVKSVHKLVVMNPHYQIQIDATPIPVASVAPRSDEALLKRCHDAVTLKESIAGDNPLLDVEEGGSRRDRWPRGWRF
eukprot:NODE_3273_length_410_cov_605.008310_g2744_i0.p1 GENE.NODE_3273_length_410_cov_605.008310_g2744_i0~~NODE_3273_length_410_cov_605.008310_g2744_i0.p1  ORF type:complete len:120 (+),score=25.39 NODE_3273_length_410_cov_605.008310_g2744_i0:2-361(+)